VRTDYAAVSGVDPLAVTDAQGEFVITAVDPFESMDVQVEARLASRIISTAANHFGALGAGSGLGHGQAVVQN
jgi:hypothetical protein